MPKYIQLANDIIKTMHLDENPRQEKLPTEEALANTYHVSRQTVRNALSYLRNMGVIDSRQGSGSYTTGLSLSKRRNEIPVLLQAIHEYIYPDLWYYLRETMTEQGFKLTAYITNDEVKQERDILISLLELSPRCMIVEGCKSALPNPNLDLYHMLEKNGTFFIFLHNMYPTIQNGVCIKDDNYYGGYLLGEYLLSHGHNQIAGIFESDTLQGLERYHGFICCMRDHETLPDEQEICWFRNEQINRLRNQKDMSFLQEFLKSIVPKETAIICYNDEIAYWVSRAAIQMGLQIPQDLSLVSFDNSYLCALCSVPLTSIAHEEHEISHKAAEAAVQKLKGLPVSSQEIPWKLYERGSVARLNS